MKSITIFLSSIYFLFTFIIDVNIAHAKDINLAERGVIGDGVYDNWKIIQESLDEIINSGGGKLYFPAGDFAIYNKSIVIWGNNIELIGDRSSRTTIIKRGKVGYFGECIDIAGKISGYQYYGDFGKGDYAIRRIYRGKSVPVKNVVLSYINITSDLSDNTNKRLIANNLGIINAEGVKVLNCRINNAPQSNVAIVNDTELFKNKNIVFINCEFSGSGQHSVRVISYNKGSIVGNSVSFENCRFTDVRGKDISQKEIKNERIHLWHRGLGIQKDNELELKNCYFDDSGYIFVNGTYTNFNMSDCTLQNALVFQLSVSRLTPNITINRSTFNKKGNFSEVLRSKSKANKERKLANPFKETEFGIIYPSTLKYILN